MADVNARCCRIFLFLIGYCILHTKGLCEFPKAWAGHWFQSGMPHTLLINATSIQTKGDCYEEQGDKYLVHDRSDNCYRCMAIHVKHASVLQYKETYCESKSSFQAICYGITGDAPLYSMFRKHPEARPVPCPFKGAPFTFSYSRGSGDCGYPPSQAESCTDDSRLVLRYQACPDIASTESYVEELVCLATWKEGSTRYLIGRLRQGGWRAASDEDQFRCFVYQRNVEGGRAVYNIAQSGDATCSGLQNAFEGSRTMKLTSVDLQHTRCKFPIWVTEHHTWLSLDHRRTYRFSQRNATLKILDEDIFTSPSSPSSSGSSASSNSGGGGSASGSNVNQQHNGGGGGESVSSPLPPMVGPLGLGGLGGQSGQGNQFGFQDLGLQSEGLRRGNGEARVVCHGILQAPYEGRKVQIVAHVTAGCDSGYVCMVFYKRDNNVIEIQQSDVYQENPNDACRLFDTNTAPFTTLITPTLHSKRCPHPGRFQTTAPPPPINTNPHLSTLSTSGRRKRQQQQQQSTVTGGTATGLGSSSNVGVDGVGMVDKVVLPHPPHPACLQPAQYGYEGLATGCTSPDVMEFRTPCPTQPTHAYTCHGSWQDSNHTHYVIVSPVARRSSDPLRLCLAYTLDGTATPGNLSTASLYTTSMDIAEQQHYMRQYGSQQQMSATGSAGSMQSARIGQLHHEQLVFNQMRLSGMSGSCYREVTPGSGAGGATVFAVNFTVNGTCAQTESSSTSIFQHFNNFFLFFILISFLISTHYLNR